MSSMQQPVAEEEDDVDDAAATESVKPLPLSDPVSYWRMVILLYRSSLPIILGNMLEWLDFGIYGYSEDEISQQLFAGNSAVFWVMFALGYAVRPLGAYVLGRLADERSRKLSFIISVLGMASSTALMSAIPALCDKPGVTINYCVKQLWMTALPATFLRVVQGFCAGGAAGGVNVIQSELWSTSDRKGVMAQAVGMNNVSGAAASMAAAGIVLGMRAGLGPESFAAWGWRLAFLVVVPPSLISSCLMHKTMEESNEYSISDGHSKNNEDDDMNGGSGSASKDIIDSNNDTTDGKLHSMEGAAAVEASSTTTTVTTSKPRKEVENNNNESNDAEAPQIQLWLIVLSIYVQFVISGYNLLNTFMVQYAQETYGLSANYSTLIAVVGKAIQVLMTFPSSFAADTKGWFWVAGLGGILCTILALPMMAASNLGGLAAVWTLSAVIEPAVATLWIANAPLLATSIFSVETRSKWTSFVMACGTAIAGFLPLALDLISTVYGTGGVLTALAGTGAVGIIYIRNRAKAGIVKIFQRPELY